MSLTRRTFIGGSVATGVSVAFFSSPAQAATSPAGKSLVVVQMFGGNDTLNTFIPYTDPRYRQARPTLAIPERALLPIDQTFAFHPSLAPLLPYYQNRKFAFITDVGFPALDRSHFYCADVWHTASESPGSSGWLGRFADQYLSGGSPLTSIAMGTSIPRGITGSAVTPTTIVDLPSFDIDVKSTNPEERARFIASVRALYATRLSGDSEFIRTSGLRMLDTIELLKTVPPASVMAPYPRNADGTETELARALRVIAQTISANLGTTIAWVMIDGFDTHSQQIARASSGGSLAGTHAALLANLAGSLAAFQQELAERRIDDRVLVLGWSEFGRRLSENASLGCDHGKAGSAFVLGNHVRGGTVYGGAPDLADLDQGDLRTKTDFRSIYSTVIRDWFGRDPIPVLGREYENLGFIEPGRGRSRTVRL